MLPSKKTAAVFAEAMGRPNMTLLRRLCVNLIKRDKAKGSINTKRYRAAMNNDYALTLLGLHNSEA